MHPPRVSPRLATTILVLATITSACSGSSTSGAGSVGSPPAASASLLSQPNPTSPTPAADVAGAMELAVRYVASTDQLMAHSPIGRREILSRLVAPDVLDAQTDALQAATDRMAEKLGGSVDELVWVEAPIAATIESATAGGVVVGVWSVSVTGFTDHAPEEVWRTTHITLTADATGRWWVTAATADAGPTPIGSELALPSGWADFATVAAWTPVVAGEGL